MIPKLENKYLRLEQTRNRLLDELEALTDEQLNTAAPGGKWSLNQHVAHLIMVDEVTLNSIQYKLKQPGTLKPAGFSQALKALLLKVALLSGRKYKAPAPVADVPDHSDLQDLRHNWNNARFALEDTLTALNPDQIDKCLFKHPRVGPLNVLQTLAFLQDHFDHHQKIMQQQIRDLVY
ncbi:DinB family protein [Pontibacter oryzae]|uniref:DinB family protein n=2 Tax=Pontibacter oryzae TaxID=2304593 RepID=A0A399SK35_9BACT|nr:DinB family protein [Pontibacter oryzae]